MARFLSDRMPQFMPDRRMSEYILYVRSNARLDVRFSGRYVVGIYVQT